MPLESGWCPSDHRDDQPTKRVTENAGDTRLRTDNALTIDLRSGLRNTPFRKGFALATAVGALAGVPLTRCGIGRSPGAPAQGWITTVKVRDERKRVVSREYMTHLCGAGKEPTAATWALAASSN